MRLASGATLFKISLLSVSAAVIVFQSSGKFLISSFTILCFPFQRLEFRYLSIPILSLSIAKNESA